jgi:hypothetical protein
LSTKIGKGSDELGDVEDDKQPSLEACVKLMAK